MPQEGMIAVLEKSNKGEVAEGKQEEEENEMMEGEVRNNLYQSVKNNNCVIQLELLNVHM